MMMKDEEVEEDGSSNDERMEDRPLHSRLGQADVGGNMGQPATGGE
jgi:hypothetical protein